MAKFIPTCSVMFRRGMFEEFPQWASDLKMTDWLLHILNAREGKIGYINEVLGTYRMHSGGIWSTLDYKHQLFAEIEFLVAINKNLELDRQYQIEVSISKRWDKLASLLVEQVDKENLSIASALNQIHDELDNVASRNSPPPKWIGEILGKAYGRHVVLNSNRSDIKTTRYCWIMAVRYYPAWLKNRGFLSLGVEAFFGKRVANYLRKFNRVL